TLRLLTEDVVDHHGAHFDLTNASLPLKPVQLPHPPVWMAASADPAVRRAARYGFSWLINPHASLGNVERQTALYRATLAEHGHRPPADVPIFKELSIADAREKALETARPYLEEKYRSYADWGLDRPMGEGERLSVPFEELAKDRFIVGTPEECSEEIDR